MSEWISVKDRLPENSHLVLIYGKGATSYIIVGSYFPKEKFWIDYHFHALNSVTHWMPLPTPPEKPYEEWDRIKKEREDAVH